MPCQEALAMKDAKHTTEAGFVNRNGQVVIRNTGKPGTDRGQSVKFANPCLSPSHSTPESAALDLSRT